MKTISIGDLKPDKKNARKHDDRNIGMITSSLKELGPARSIVIDEDNNILAGNGTVKAMADAGLKNVRVIEADGDELIAVQRNGLTKEQKTRLALYDNRTAETAEWDLEILESIGVDIEYVFDDLWTTDELTDLFGTEETPDELPGEDDAPEGPAKPTTKPGDIYQLGDHFLMCGDSTDHTQVEILMQGQKADMIFTDPPYGIDYQGVSDKREKIRNDNMPDNKFLNFLVEGLMDCGVIYVCCSWQNAHIFKEAMNIIGKPPKAMIVWDKVNPAQHLDKYFKQHEIIFYSGEFGGQKTVRGDIWQLKRQQHTYHPTMKPIELIEIALGDHSKLRTVYDPFGGSGSTLIACEKLKRKCYMMELDPGYCDVIVERYKNLFPEKTVCLSSGGTSDVIGVGSTTGQNGCTNA